MTPLALLSVSHALLICPSFFFNDTATTEIYTLSLHDALPISAHLEHAALENHKQPHRPGADDRDIAAVESVPHRLDRKSTRLNSSHTVMSYAVFCLKKKTALSSMKSISAT